MTPSEIITAAQPALAARYGSEAALLATSLLVWSHLFGWCWWGAHRQPIDLEV